MSEENINEETVVEKNIPVFIETDGHTVQVGWASEVQENGGRAIEKFSAFKKVVLVNPIFGDGEGEIEAPIESHVDPEQDGLTETDQNDIQTADGRLYEHVAQSNGFPTETHDGDNNPIQNSAPVEAGTDPELNAEPVAADPDGSDLLENDAPAQNGHPFGSDNHDENVSSDLSTEDEEAEFERQLAEEQAREKNHGAS